MLNYTENKIGAQEKTTGEKILSNTTITGITLKEFVLSPRQPPNETIVLENVTFERCKIPKGPLTIRAGTKLINTKLCGVSSKESLVISTDCIFSNFTVKGEELGGLWIRPDEIFDLEQKKKTDEWLENNKIKPGIAINISELKIQHIEIFGIPIELIITSPENQIKIFQTIEDLPSWIEMGISRGGFWHLAIRRMKTFKSRNAVFNLPTINSLDYEVAMKEMNILTAYGAMVL